MKGSRSQSAKPLSAAAALPLQESGGVREDSWLLPICVSLLLHFLVVLFIFVNPRAQTYKIKPAPAFIAARMVVLGPGSASKSRKAVSSRKVENAASVREQPAQSASKSKPSQDVISLRRKQEEQRKQEEEKKNRLEEEKERKLEWRRRVEQHKERQRKRLEEKRRREALRKQQEQEQLAALAQEKEAEQLAEHEAQVVASYVGILQQLVEDHWNRPPSARRGMSAMLRVRFLPTGELVSVKVLRSSGDTAFDKSASQAVERAAPFKELQALEPHLFEKNFRSLSFEFDTEDLLE